MELRLSDLSEGFEGATITLWHVAENGYVTKGQDLLEVATDKATFDVSAPCNGVLSRVIKKAGEEVKADEVIAELEEDGS